MKNRFGGIFQKWQGQLTNQAQFKNQYNQEKVFTFSLFY